MEIEIHFWVIALLILVIVISKNGILKKINHSGNYKLNWELMRKSPL
jgi:hypothetical protein